MKTLILILAILWTPSIQPQREVPQPQPWYWYLNPLRVIIEPERKRQRPNPMDYHLKQYVPYPLFDERR